MSNYSNWILTSTGREFDYIDPQLDMISIADIAKGLACESRFAGQTKSFYSVAQHSIIASQNIAPEFAIEALFHDAAEAYCKDIPTPLKALLPGYKEIEKRVAAVIREKYGLPAEESPEVKEIDLRMMATERIQLLPWHHEPWEILKEVIPLPVDVSPWMSGSAEVFFIGECFGLGVFD